MRRLLIMGMLVGVWAHAESLDSFAAGDLVEIHVPGSSKVNPEIPRILLGQIEKKLPDCVRIFVFWDDAGWDTDWVRALFSFFGENSKFYQKNPPKRETIRRDSILQIHPWVRTKANPDPHPPYNFEKGRLWKPEDMVSVRGSGDGMSKSMRRP